MSGLKRNRACSLKQKISTESTAKKEKQTEHGGSVQTYFFGDRVPASLAGAALTSLARQSPGESRH